MASVTLEKVSKFYGNVEAVKKINLEIKDNEFLVLVGPSGCGKSSTLRMIAGLEEIDEGKINIGDRMINQLEPRERNVSMVFQNYALYPHMTVQENLGFSLKIAGMKKDDIDKRVAEAASVLDIEEFLQRKPAQLSGGQRQRVAMGRAIVRRPDVFLFDEPLSNLDAKLRNQMRTEIKRLHQKVQTTIVYVTHDQVEAMTLADQIVVLNEGYVAQAGAPLDLYNNPSDIFVAGFIGSPKMNFINVKSYLDNNQLSLKSQSLNMQSVIPVDVNKEFTLGIRPEHIYISEKDESDLEVTVDYSEQLGSETYFYCNTNDSSQLIVHQTGQYKVSKGDKLFLRFDRSAIHLFGVDGKAIKKNKS